MQTFNPNSTIALLHWATFVVLKKKKAVTLILTTLPQNTTELFLSSLNLLPLENITNFFLLQAQSSPE